MAIVRETAADRHRVLPERTDGQLKTDLRKAEPDDFMAEIGRCLDVARRANGWNLDQLACKLPPPEKADKRDPRQVQRWIDGKERCQLDVVFAVPALREPFVIALARLADCFDIETVVRSRRVG